jgi:hypothetical protein
MISTTAYHTKAFWPNDPSSMGPIFYEDLPFTDIAGMLSMFSHYCSTRVKDSLFKLIERNFPSLSAKLKEQKIAAFDYLEKLPFLLLCFDCVSEVSFSEEGMSEEEKLKYLDEMKRFVMKALQLLELLQTGKVSSFTKDKMANINIAGNKHQAAALYYLHRGKKPGLEEPADVPLDARMNFLKQLIQELSVRIKQVYGASYCKGLVDNFVRAFPGEQAEEMPLTHKVTMRDTELTDSRNIEGPYIPENFSPELFELILKLPSSESVDFEGYLRKLNTEIAELYGPGESGFEKVCEALRYPVEDIQGGFLPILEGSFEFRCLREIFPPQKTSNHDRHKVPVPFDEKTLARFLRGLALEWWAIASLKAKPFQDFTFHKVGPTLPDSLGGQSVTIDGVFVNSKRERFPVEIKTLEIASGKETAPVDHAVDLATKQLMAVRRNVPDLQETGYIVLCVVDLSTGRKTMNVQRVDLSLRSVHVSKAKKKGQQPGNAEKSSAPAAAAAAAEDTKKSSPATLLAAKGQFSRQKKSKPVKEYDPKQGSGLDDVRTSGAAPKFASSSSET